jgi:hypothetical protein
MTNGHGVELKVMVPCAEGRRHQVRLRFTGWGEYEVVYNPCEALLGEVFAPIAGCSRYIREEFPKRFWNALLQRGFPHLTREPNAGSTPSAFRRSLAEEWVSLQQSNFGKIDG